MNPSVRQPDESFEEYKARRVLQNRLEHRYLRGEGRQANVTKLFRPTYDDIAQAAAARMAKEKA